jgi:hypothetical protein
MSEVLQEIHTWHLRFGLFFEFLTNSLIMCGRMETCSSSVSIFRSTVHVVVSDGGFYYLLLTE